MMASQSKDGRGAAGCAQDRAVGHGAVLERDALVGREAQLGAGGLREGAGPGDVVGVDVGLQDRADPQAVAPREVEVHARVQGRIDDDRLPAGADQVRQRLPARWPDDHQEGDAQQRPEEELPPGGEAALLSGLDQEVPAGVQPG